MSPKIFFLFFNSARYQEHVTRYTRNYCTSGKLDSTTCY